VDCVQPAAAARHAACCERGNQRFHRESSVQKPPGAQQGCVAHGYSGLYQSTVRRTHIQNLRYTTPI